MITFYITIIILSIMLIIVSICLFKSIVLNDNVRFALSKEQSKYWDMVENNRRQITKIEQQREYLELQLKKFTSANLYLNYKD